MNMFYYHDSIMYIYAANNFDGCHNSLDVHYYQTDVDIPRTVGGAMLQSDMQTKKY